MEAHERSFNFMGTASYYDIPFFQRAYVWDEENWQELLANFLDQTDSHFLGSIILKQEKLVSGSHPRYMIIDGQQRLTTLSILTRACFDRLIEDKDSYEESVVSDFKQELRNLLFIKPNKFAAEEDVKIQHSKLDAPDFQDVIKGKYADCIADGKWNDKYKNETSRIVRCYLYFRKELHDRPVSDVHKIWNLMTEEYPRYLVNIDLDADENEQKIFDTVNSFGVRLSSSDTIKNSVFQGYIEALRKDGQPDIRKRASELYENTWEKVFEGDEEIKEYWETTRRYGRISKDNLEVFLNSFAVIQGFFDPAEDNMVALPQKYKEVVATMDWKGIRDFLNLIAKYAEVYAQYFSNFDNDTLLTYSDYKTRLLHICHTLDVATFYPYILKLLYENEVVNTLSDEELKDLLGQLERYIILTAICNGSTKNYNKECAMLVQGKKIPDDYRNASAYISKRTFEDGLLNQRVNRLPTVLLFWVELYNRGTNDYADIKDLKYDYTLEHIMPQKWQKNWSIEAVPVIDENGNLVEDKAEAESIRSAAVYEIGNMTLLNSKLNTAVSNGDFNTKLNGDGKKYKHCMKNLADLYLTREVVAEKEWNEPKIFARTDRLMNQIKDVWNIEFEEDKPVHLEIDANDIEKAYEEIFIGMNQVDAVDMVDRSDLNDDVKSSLMYLFFFDYLATRVDRQLIYGVNKNNIFDKDVREMLSIIGDYSCGDYVNTLLSVDADDPEKTLNNVLNSLKFDAKENIIDEVIFYDSCMKLVKNRFEGFYKELKNSLGEIKCDPIVYDLCDALNEFYTMRDGEVYTLKDLKGRIKSLKPYTEKYPDSVIFNTLLGWCYYNDRKYKDAIPHFESVLKNKAFSIFDVADIEFWLGYAYSTFDPKKAIEHYEQALLYLPDYGDLLNNLGFAYYKSENYEKALELYEECMKVDPENVYARNNKVKALIKLNRLDELKEYVANPPKPLRKHSIKIAEKAINKTLSDEEMSQSEYNEGDEEGDENE